MRSWSFGALAKSVAGALFGMMLLTSTGMAALTSQQLQALDQQFLANPQQFLSQNFSNGGEDLAAVIASLSQTQANLQTILSATSSANPAQQRAIGQGLGQAAKTALDNNDQTLLQAIQSAAASLTAAGFTQVAAGYNSATAGTQIASVGGGGGGGVGGPTGNGPPQGGSGGGNGNGPPNSGFFSSLPPNFLTGGNVNGGGGSNSTNGLNQAASSTSGH